MPFEAEIYKVGINAVVEVPTSVTAKMKPIKGYIPVTGKINGFAFIQTLTPIKDKPYRLYVNVPMLKGGKAKLGDTATFTLKQDNSDRSKQYPMVAALKKALTSHGLTKNFFALTGARQKDILNYLNRIKSKEIMAKHVSNVIRQLQEAKTNVRVP